MELSDHLYILKNFYEEAGVSYSEAEEFTKSIYKPSNKIKIVRHIDKTGKDAWIALDRGDSITKLKDVGTLKTIYTVPDFAQEYPEEETEFLLKYSEISDHHTSFTDLDFIKNNPVPCKVTNYILDLLELPNAEVVFVTFKWRDPTMCDWHRDGSTTYNISKITPSRLTINLPFCTTSYVELKKSDGTIIDTKDYRTDLFLMNGYQKVHRINLNGMKDRLTIAFRIRNVEFDDIVNKLIKTGSIKKVI